MSLSNQKYTYKNLCNLVGGGFSYAQLPQIIDALNTRYKEIYGNDIDVSSGSADGQFIMNESYILYNMFEIINSLYNNMNPNTATGTYLDTLASFSNIIRKSATKSTTQLFVKKTGNNPSTPFDTQIQVKDKLGNIWTAKPNTTLGTYNKNFTAAENYTLLLDFECDNFGAISAVGAGTTINNITEVFAVPTDPAKQYYYLTNGKVNSNVGSFISVDDNYLIYQATNAITGSNKETDGSLRTRLSEQRGLGATTTLDAMQSSLYDLDFIKDVKIINSLTGSGTFDDSTPKAAHEIYACIRYIDEVNTNNYKNDICNIIYNHLTPGIGTIAPVAGTTKCGTDEYVQITSDKGPMTFHWKKCTPMKPAIVITYTLNNMAIGGLSDENKISILNSINYYLDNIKIGEKLSTTKIMNAVMQGDLKSNGNNVLFPTECTISMTGEASYTGENYLSYFKKCIVETSSPTWVTEDNKLKIKLQYEV